MGRDYVDYIQRAKKERKKRMGGEDLHLKTRLPDCVNVETKKASLVSYPRSEKMLDMVR